MNKNITYIIASLITFLLLSVAEEHYYHSLCSYTLNGQYSASDRKCTFVSNQPVVEPDKNLSTIMTNRIFRPKQNCKIEHSVIDIPNHPFNQNIQATCNGLKIETLFTTSFNQDSKNVLKKIQDFNKQCTTNHITTDYQTLTNINPNNPLVCNVNIPVYPEFSTPEYNINKIFGKKCIVTNTKTTNQYTTVDGICDNMHTQTTFYKATKPNVCLQDTFTTLSTQYQK